MPYKRDPAEEAAKYQVLKFGDDEYEFKSDSCAHRLHTVGVSGSNPLSPTNFCA
jgi:hypothetical protein